MSEEPTTTVWKLNDKLPYMGERVVYCDTISLGILSCFLKNKPDRLTSMWFDVPFAEVPQVGVEANGFAVVLSLVNVPDLASALTDCESRIFPGLHSIMTDDKVMVVCDTTRNELVGKFNGIASECASEIFVKQMN